MKYKGREREWLREYRLKNKERIAFRNGKMTPEEKLAKEQARILVRERAVLSPMLKRTMYPGKQFQCRKCKEIKPIRDFNLLKSLIKSTYLPAYLCRKCDHIRLANDRAKKKRLD